MRGFIGAAWCNHSFCENFFCGKQEERGRQKTGDKAGEMLRASDKEETNVLSGKERKQCVLGESVSLSGCDV